MNKDSRRFRVWDNEEKKWASDNFCIINVDTEGHVTFNKWIEGDKENLWTNGKLYEYAEEEFDKDRFVFDSCTGIKDKNKELIYENDLVRTVTGAVGCVCWDENRGAFRVYGTHGGNEFDCDVCCTQEIIGNIHK